MEKKRARINRTAAEWQKLREAFEASGLGQSVFCKSQGIAPSSFQRWISGERTKSPKFVEFRPTPSKGIEVELQFADGSILRVRS
jgi:hypothetical protein